MHTHAAIIFSFLFLLGGATSSTAIETENKIQSTLAFFRGSAQTSTHGDPPKNNRSNIRAFVNTVCTSGPEADNCPHRGSGR